MHTYMKPQNKGQIRVRSGPVSRPRHSMISSPKEKQWRPASASTLAELAHTGKVTLKNVQAAIAGGMNVQRFQHEFWKLISLDSIGQKEADLAARFRPVLILG